MAPLVDALAGRLGDVGRAALFVESQFEAMPAPWCLDKFGVPFPPAEVVFGRGSWDRFRATVRSGRTLAVRRVR